MTRKVFDLNASEIAQICGGVTESEDGKSCTDHGPANDLLKSGGSPGPTTGF